MTVSGATKQSIEELKHENDILKRENKYLRSLTNSRRFLFAEKIANGYNGIFPKNTKRRNAVSKTVGVFGKAVNSKRVHKQKKIKNKINKLAENYDNIIVINGIPWDVKLKQRPHHFANEFSKIGFFVVYLEYENPLRKFRVIKKNIVTVNSEVYLDELPRSKKNCYFLSPNNISTKYDVLKKEVSLGYKFIYDYLDEFHEDISGNLSIQMEVWDKLRSLNPVLCIATAKRLFDEIKKHLGSSQAVIMASNAVDVDHFDFRKNETAIPPIDMREITRLEKPIIGFYGALAPWIDFGLLNKIAKRHPEWEFVYLGVDYNGAAVALEENVNVHNLGAKNYEYLPKYTKYFDCAMIPFKQGEIAKATSPVKLFEYMAAGLPTVCTKDLDECRGYDFVYMSKNDIEFEKNLEKAIKDCKRENNRLKLLDQAIKNTWSERVRVIVNNLR